MKNNLNQEVIISLIFIILIIFFLNPFGFLMPNAFLMALIPCLVVVFALFASFVWRENSKDERENLHKMMAGRVAYLVGTSLLTIGIILQGLNHNLDPWLIFILGSMVLAKIIGIIYGQIKS